MNAGLGPTVATIFTIGLIFIAIGIPVAVLNPRRWSTVLWGCASVMTGAIFVFITLVIITAGSIVQAFGRDLDGRYAQSPLHEWFNRLSSRKGNCCSNADGTALSDPDWETKDGHYRVKLEGQWWDVPDEAVITEPNRAGKTMVWPMYVRNGTVLVRVDIRCFLPGTMT